DQGPETKDNRYGRLLPDGDKDEARGTRLKRLAGEGAEALDPAKSGFLEHRLDFAVRVEAVPGEADLPAIAAHQGVAALHPAGGRVIGVFRFEPDAADLHRV